MGRRLSANGSERELTAIATRGPELLARLERSERAALGAGHLRFRVDRPVVVDVAAPMESAPFWLADRGFRETDLSLANPDARWKLYRRTFDRGPIGLGVNGLDRSPPAHYVVFIRPLEGREAGGRAERPVVTLEEGHRDSWREVVAGPRVSAASDVSRPFERLPDELVGSVMLQPAHAARHATLLATGRVWKTHVASAPQPDQVAMSFGAETGRELVWTWRTSPEVVSSAVRIVRATAEADADAARRCCPHRGGGLGLRRTSRTCSTIRSSAATGWSWADSSPTPSIDTPSAMGHRRDGDPGRP